MGALRLNMGRHVCFSICKILIYVRFDLVSSTFFKTRGRRRLQRVEGHAKPEVRSLTVGYGVALVVHLFVCVFD